MKISYGLTVCNEHIEIKNLLKYLNDRILEDDEIIVVYDSNRVTSEVTEVLMNFKRKNYFYYPFDFQQNFLDNKNFMNDRCTGDYIFQIDADEIPEDFLVKNLKTILESNPVDVLIGPRKNFVEGITESHIKEWGWVVNEHGWVNWPDLQKRIYKNIPNIKWTGHQVHGMISGYKTFTLLPMEEKWSVIHNKTIQRQENQNKRYSTI
jgi:hypothetical protein